MLNDNDWEDYEPRNDNDSEDYELCYCSTCREERAREIWRKLDENDDSVLTPDASLDDDWEVFVDSDDDWDPELGVDESKRTYYFDSNRARRWANPRRGITASQKRRSYHRRQSRRFRQLAWATHWKDDVTA